jgi:hypothetical protein
MISSILDFESHSSNDSPRRCNLRSEFDLFVRGHWFVIRSDQGSVCIRAHPLGLLKLRSWSISRDARSVACSYGPRRGNLGPDPELRLAAPIAIRAFQLSTHRKSRLPYATSDGCQEAMSFKLSLWKTKMETFQLPMNTVATTIKSYALIAASKVVCGADLNVSGKPLSQGEMRIHFGVDKTYRTDSSSARCLVCISGPSRIERASERTRS